MEKQLPKNWVETTLGNVSNIVTGNTPSKSNDEFYGDYIPWVKPGDINTANILYSSEENLSAIGLQKARLIPKGSIMVTCIGNLGNVAMAGVDMTTNQQINSIVLYHNLLYDKYLLFYSITLKKWLVENSTSTTISMVNKSNFEKAPMLLPPLAEQKRIAEKLDALFGQLDSVRGAMSRIPTLIANLRQQILTHAVTGKLTQEWRKKNALVNKYFNINADEHREYEYIMPDNWCLLSFNDVVTIESNLVNPDDFLNLPLIAPDNVESMTGRLISKPLVSEITPISLKHHFKSGTLIYSKIRPYLSKIVYVDFEGLCSADMYPLKTQLSIFYLYFYMLSSEFLAFATTAGERSVLPKINQKSLNIIPIPIPPIEEQEEIVSRVKSLFEKLDSIKQRYQMLKTKLENLPQAILHKAFKGELVEQLLSDGNATDLLREIEQLKKSIKKK